MREARRLAFWALVVVMVGTLMATPAAAATFVYVGNAESNEVYVLQLDRSNGDLTVVEKVAIPGIEKPGISTPMALSCGRARSEPSSGPNPEPESKGGRSAADSRGGRSQAEQEMLRDSSQRHSGGVPIA